MGAEERALLATSGVRAVVERLIARQPEAFWSEHAMLVGWVQECAQHAEACKRAGHAVGAGQAPTGAAKWQRPWPARASTGVLPLLSAPRPSPPIAPQQRI